jgi:hypothetical protein
VRRWRMKRAILPAKCIDCSTKEVSGSRDPKHISTSFVERQNWTGRTTVRLYIRLSNGFSRKRPRTGHSYSETAFTFA